MNRTRLIFIGVLALAVGAVASILAFRLLQSRAVAAQSGGEDVVVAAGDIIVGTRIQDKDVRVVRVPAEALPPGRFTQKSKVVGRGVILPIAAGEFILPGNPSGSSEPQTITVLKNIAVLATGQKLDRNLLSGESSSGGGITLLVSPDDAQKLALATNQGHIQLALRNPLDTIPSDVAAVSAHTLYQKQGAPPPVTHQRPKPLQVTQAPVLPPSAYPVEVIKGDKRDITKLPD